MCYHRLFIHTTCGHPIWGPLLRACSLLGPSTPTPSVPHPSSQSDFTCPNRQYHPYQTIKLDSLCKACQREQERSFRLLEMEKRENGDWDFAVGEERAGWRRLADREAGLKVKGLLEGSANAEKKEGEVKASDRSGGSSEPGPRDSEAEMEMEPGPASGRVNPVPNSRAVISDRTSRIPRPTETWPHSNSVPPARPN